MLTNEQCYYVIDELEKHEFTGFTGEDIRLFEAIIEAAKSQNDAGAKHE
jgi:hypothetical protein